MRLLATGLLGLMLVVFVVARTFESTWPALSWVRAFAEAAMVGALADWFAVVALFRHPLGIPIPHTAVIPNRKNQIARNLGEFVQGNFLTAEKIAGKLRQLDLVRRLGDWLVAEENAEWVAGKATDGLPRVLDAMDEDGMRQFLREQAVRQIRRVPLAPLAGRLLGVMSENGRDQELFEQALRITRQAVGDNAPLIKAKVVEELSAIPDWPVLAEAKGLVSRSLSEKIVARVQGTLDDILQDKNHVVRAQFDERMERFVEDLRNSSEMAERAEQLKEGFLGNRALTGSLDALWTALKDEIKTDLAAEDSRMRQHLAGMIRGIGQSLAADEVFRAKLDAWVEQTVQSLVTAHGHEIGTMIRETVEAWDAREIAEKLETQVGGDLQFIRINGTLVGGLVGVVIHAISRVIW